MDEKHKICSSSSMRRSEFESDLLVWKTNVLPHKLSARDHDENRTRTPVETELYATTTQHGQLSVRKNFFIFFTQFKAILKYVINNYK